MMTERNTKLCFEKEKGSDTSIMIIRDGKSIGRIWSEVDSKETGIFLPYPHDKDKEYCKNSVQICGFDNISQIWGCGVFEGKKDCVISFNTTDTEYDLQKLKEYEEYVKGFFTSRVKELKTGCSSFNVSEISGKGDFTRLKSFNDWLLHNI